MGSDSKRKHKSEKAEIGDVQNSPRKGFEEASREAIACAGSSSPFLTPSPKLASSEVLIIGGPDERAEGSVRFGIEIDLRELLERGAEGREL